MFHGNAFESCYENVAVFILAAAPASLVGPCSGAYNGVLARPPVTLLPAFFFLLVLPTLVVAEHHADGA